MYPFLLLITEKSEMINMQVMRIFKNRDGSRAAATSKMEHFVIKVNG